MARFIAAAWRLTKRAAWPTARSAAAQLLQRDTAAAYHQLQRSRLTLGRDAAHCFSGRHSQRSTSRVSAAAWLSKRAAQRVNEPQAALPRAAQPPRSRARYSPARSVSRVQYGAVQATMLHVQRNIHQAQRSAFSAAQRELTSAAQPPRMNRDHGAGTRSSLAAAEFEHAQLSALTSAAQRSHQRSVSLLQRAAVNLGASDSTNKAGANFGRPAAERTPASACTLSCSVHRCSAAHASPVLQRERTQFAARHAQEFCCNMVDQQLTNGCSAAPAAAYGTASGMRTLQRERTPCSA
ncbi:hypothetical protein KOW79_013514 [Hemibagrus wyckioides]|uniref:Uncharacterized protein n=1 Tax=Hemibagrus wyckioides TaxID=337641 RepID=A0A9D3SGX5_9TELE|nr:hypothetical protein KOW79_013514 [Hemibagrus wyckioides]